MRRRFGSCVSASVIAIASVCSWTRAAPTAVAAWVARASSTRIVLSGSSAAGGNATSITPMTWAPTTIGTATVPSSPSWSRASWTEPRGWPSMRPKRAARPTSPSPSGTGSSPIGSSAGAELSAIASRAGSSALRSHTTTRPEAVMFVAAKQRPRMT